MYRTLEQFLGSKAAKYQLISHPVALTAQEEAARTHTPGRSVAKVVIVKERDGLVVAVVPATYVLDLGRLKGLIGHGDVRLATVEEIREAISDCLPGAIPPFGELFEMRTFVDRSLLNTREVTMPAGELGQALRMRTAEFRRIGDFREGEFATAESLVRPTATTRR
jgi:Ala-tRNA(Pro) deacylase